MSANGISHLPLKKDRQLAKLALAETKRQADANRNDVLDTTLLPTTYGNTNNPGDIVDNPNPGGLQPNRPWKP